MKDLASTIKVLILDNSENEAENLVNLFRNAGRATQAQLIQSENQLRELLAERDWDLCLANDSSSEPDPAGALSLIQKHEQDIPVLILCNDVNGMDPAAALAAGFQDVIPAQNQAHILLASLRELKALDDRRERRKAEIGLREAEKRSRLLLDSSRDAIAYVHDGMHIYANQAYVKLFGYPEFDELEGMPLMDMVVSDDQDKLKVLLKGIGDNTSESTEFAFTGNRDDGTNFQATMEFSSAQYHNEFCTQIVIRTGKNDSENESLRNHDIVTGLINQQAFYDQLDSAIERAQRTKQESSMLFILLDDFAALSKSVGAAGTNLLLGDLGKLLKSQVQEPDVAARLGDSEFALLFQGLDSKQATQKAEEICRSIAENESEISGKSVKTTASLGISLVNENTSNPNQIISKAADSAKHVQTEQGGNSVKQHSGYEIEAAQNEKVIRILKTALEKDLFKLVFQPIVSLRGDSSGHYEAMVRMPDESGNDISPAQFLSLAAHEGLTRQIDRWVIENTINKLKTHLEGGLKTHVFVNITVESVMDPTLLPWVSSLINESRLPGDSIIFQFSETAASTNLSHVKEFVKGINQLHCKSALTHFGRSLNPFNSLKHLAVSYVKIDSSFITELTKNDDNKEELKTLVSSLHTQGKLTVAPFVDSASLLPVLWQAGINYIQGYYIQQPSASMDYDFSTEDED